MSTATKRRRLWLPASAQPTDTCRICGHPFFAGEERALVRHVRKCAEQHARTESPRVKLPALMDPAHAPDPELEAWVKRHRGAILLGDKRM